MNKTSFQGPIKEVKLVRDNQHDHTIQITYCHMKIEKQTEQEHDPLPQKSKKEIRDMLEFTGWDE